MSSHIGLVPTQSWCDRAIAARRPRLVSRRDSNKISSERDDNVPQDSFPGQYHYTNPSRRFHKIFDSVTKLFGGENDQHETEASLSESPTNFLFPHYRVPRKEVLGLHGKNKANSNKPRIPSLLSLATKSYCNYLPWLREKTIRDPGFHDDIRNRSSLSMYGVSESTSEIESYLNVPKFLTTFILEELISSHKLDETMLQMLQGTWLLTVDLSKYCFQIDSNWIKYLCRIEGIQNLKINNVKNINSILPETSIPDEDNKAAFEEPNWSLETLDLSGCSKIRNQSILKVCELSRYTLLELNLSNCFWLTDFSLLTVLACTNLRKLSVSRLRLLSSTFLCQLSILTELETLDVSGCGNVSDKVVEAWTFRDDFTSVLEIASSLLPRPKRTKALEFLEKCIPLASWKTCAGEPSVLLTQDGFVDAKDNFNELSASNMNFSSDQSLSNIDMSELFTPREEEMSKGGGVPIKTGMFNLKHLDISRTSIGSFGLEKISVNFELSHLSIEACQGMDSGVFDHISEMLSLESLKAGFIEDAEVRWSKISTLALLETLDLSYLEIPRIESLHLQGLGYLCLKGCKFHATTIEASITSSATKLLELNLESCTLTRSTIDCVFSLTRLKKLNLSHARLEATNRFLSGDKSSVAFADTIEVIQLEGLNLPKGLVSLLIDVCECLATFDISASQSQEEGVCLFHNVEWANLLALERLNVHELGNDWCNKGILKHLLPAAKTLKCLNLGNRFRSNDIDFLPHYRKLEEICFSGSRSFSNAEMKRLCQMYGINETLKKLNISATFVTKEGLSYLWLLKFLEEFVARDLNLPPAVIYAAKLKYLWHIAL